MSNNNLQPLEEVMISLDSFIQRVGIVDTTAWRWRKQGWLNTTNIAGRQYLMPKDIQEFNRRATAGEFAKEHKTPKRKRKNPESAPKQEAPKSESSHSE